MSVRTKKPPTDAQCILTVTGPMARAATALMALRALGFVEAAPPAPQSVDAEPREAVPWREVFPPIPDAERPGRMLRAARMKEALSQIHLAQLTGIPQRHISEMEHGKRSIGKDRAKKLAEALKVDYHVFL
jgi:helix-turn-helix protein